MQSTIFEETREEKEVRAFQFSPLRRRDAKELEKDAKRE